MLEVCCQGGPEGGVDLVGHAKLFAGVQDQGCNGRVVGVADAWEKVVHHLQEVRQAVSTRPHPTKSEQQKGAVWLELVLLAGVLCQKICHLWYCVQNKAASRTMCLLVVLQPPVTAGQLFCSNALLGNAGR